MAKFTFKVEKVEPSGELDPSYLLELRKQSIDRQVKAARVEYYRDVQEARSRERTEFTRWTGVKPTVAGIGRVDVQKATDIIYYSIWSAMLNRAAKASKADALKEVQPFGRNGKMLTPTEIKKKMADAAKARRSKLNVCESWRYFSRFIEWCDKRWFPGSCLVIILPDCNEFSPENCMFVAKPDMHKLRLIKQLYPKHLPSELLDTDLGACLTEWYKENQK